MTYQIYPAGYLTTDPPTLYPDGTRFEVSLDYPDTSRRVGSNAWKISDQYRLDPPPHAIELYRLAVLVYLADTRIPRRSAFNHWERDIVVHVPVADVAPWLAIRDTVVDLLSFLTGDHWRVEFFASGRSRPPRDEKAWEKGSHPNTDVVALFSGGLDSLVGAIDLLSVGESPLLVGHCESPSTAHVQSSVLEALRAKYRNAGPLLQFWIRCPSLFAGKKEDTTRSRSFLFFGLSTLVAAGLKRVSRIVVPENGFIALNAPLTRTRLGALSTRTVHPHTISQYRALLHALGISATVETPYSLLTKGEMLQRAADQQVLKEVAPISMSCAHPSAGRWRGGNPFKHCGRCVPCIIRRASLASVGWDDASDYVTDLLTVSRGEPKLEDARAFLAAIEARKAVSPLVSALRSGPIPPDAGPLGEFGALYSRGLEEVEALLGARASRRL